jgi:hypothetical protein
MRTRSKLFRSSLAVLLLTSLLLQPNEARAEEGLDAAGPIAVGTRVRLLAPATVQGPIQGTVMAIDNESLTLSTEDHRPLRVSRYTITRVEVSTGRQGHALIGLLIGAPVGAVVGAVVPLDSGCTQAQLEVKNSSCMDSRGALIAAGVLGYAGLGALIGHLIKTERWSSIPPERVRLSLAPAPGRGARLLLAVRW